MIIWSILPLVSSIFIILLGCLVYLRNQQSPLHRIFVLLCLSMSYWAFTEFEMRCAESARFASFWHTAGLIWPFSIALLVHFVLVFTETSATRRQLFTAVALYLPATVFTAANALYVRGTVSQVPWGWTVNLGITPWLYGEFAWGIPAGIFAFGRCLFFYVKAPSFKMRKMAKHVLIGISFPLVLGGLSQVVLPLLGVQTVELTASACSLFAVFVAYAMWRHALFAFTPATAAESIISTMSDPLFLVDNDHLIRHVNAAAVKALGYQTHELLEHPISKIFPPYSADTDTRHLTFQHVLGAGVVSDVETQFMTKDNRRIPVSLSWSTTRSNTGEVLGTTFIARDITERIRLREGLEKAKVELEARVEERTSELKVSNDLLRTEITERKAADEKLAAEKEYLAVTLRSIGDGVIATDPAGTVTIMNDVAAQLTGWNAAEALGKPLGTVFVINDERTRERLPDPSAAVIATGDIARAERTVLLRSSDGIERTVAQSGAPIKDGVANICGAVIVFRDLSEQRQLEEEIFKSRRLESLAALAGGIAHDFNNILTNIMTNLFMARTQVEPDSEAFDLLAETEKAAFRASTLTKQLLTFSQGAAPIRSRCRIREIIEDCAGFCLGETDVEYQIECADDIADVEVDRGQIDQALNSIITNAAQALGGTGTVQIRAHAIQVGRQDFLPVKEGSYVAVSVHDEGKGIPESMIHTIFDPYVTTKTNAAGLGLATAYSLVKKHDGCITVDSKEGHGSTFTVYMPALPADDNKPGAEPTPQATDQAKGRILLMDDEEYIRMSTGKLLTILGYEVATARDGAGAIESYRNARSSGAPFDVVILDLTVSNGMGGVETMGKLREVDPGVTGIVSSGYVNDPVMTSFAEYGFKAAISKPYEIEELSEKLRKAIGDL